LICGVTVGQILHIGCYTKESGGTGEGINAAERDPHTGALTAIGLRATTTSPSFLAAHPTLPVLYAVNEVASGAVGAWRITPAGAGRLAAEPLTGGDTGGDSPCHLAVTSDGRHLISTNYASGSISVHRIDPTGAIGARTDLLVHDGHGPDPERQVSAHAHMISIDPRGGPAHVVDLGTDAIYPYVLDAGRLVPSGPRVHVRAGTGPRHLARHPDGRRVYVVGEIDPTITVFEVDGHGWHERHRVPSSARDGLRQPSEIVMRADGRFLYVANRGVDTVSAFALDGAAPALVDEVDCQGVWPRHLAIVGEHLYVANERSHSIAVFDVDAASGKLSATGYPYPSPSPTCVLPATASMLTADGPNAGLVAT
jgi:6-phosphogluconolactonase (cycloisomerase 2 family)